MLRDLENVAFFDHDEDAGTLAFFGSLLGYRRLIGRWDTDAGEPFALNGPVLLFLHLSDPPQEIGDWNDGLQDGSVIVLMSSNPASVTGLEVGHGMARVIGLPYRADRLGGDDQTTAAGNAVQTFAARWMEGQSIDKLELLLTGVTDELVASYVLALAVCDGLVVPEAICEICEEWADKVWPSAQAQYLSRAKRDPTSEFKRSEEAWSTEMLATAPKESLEAFVADVERSLGIAGDADRTAHAAAEEQAS